jgi:hypothetical protein
MAEYTEETDELDIPPGVGKPAVVKMFSQVLDLPRVHTIVVTTSKIEWTRHRRADEPALPLEVDLESVLPYGVIRSHELREILIDSLPNAIAALGMVFTQAHLDGYNPITFVTGSNSTLGRWYLQSTGIVLPPDTLLGYPVQADTHIDDETLILCTGLSRQATLVDTRMSYKITIPRRK